MHFWRTTPIDRVPGRRDYDRRACRQSPTEPHALPNLRSRCAVGRIVSPRDAVARAGAVPPSERMRGVQRHTQLQRESRDRAIRDYLKRRFCTDARRILHS